VRLLHMSLGHFFLKAKQVLVHGGSFKLRSYEVDCLDAWKRTLSSEGVALFNEQLKRLNVYQRYGDEKLLCLYDMKDKSCAHWPKEILFPCQLEEVRVARLQLHSASGGSKEMIKADVTLSCGRFFGLEFNKSPKSLLFGAKITKVNVLLDPMIPSGGDGVTTDQCDQLLESIDAKLPVEYLDLVAGGKDVVIDVWKIYNLAHVRKVVQPDRNYYLLAEKEGHGAIGVAEEDQSGHLYYLDYEDDRPVKIETSLREFLKNGIRVRPG